MLLERQENRLLQLQSKYFCSFVESLETQAPGLEMDLRTEGCLFPSQWMRTSGCEDDDDSGKSTFLVKKLYGRKYDP